MHPDPEAPAANDDSPVVRKLEQFAQSHGDSYRCQATQLPEFTELLHWWDLRQYLRDLRTGNVGIGRMISVSALSVFRGLMKIGIGTRALLFFYNKFQSITGGRPFPVIGGTLEQTPTLELGLKPGDLVRIKSLDEINATLDILGKNRGMSFDPEMARFCGGVFRVSSRVERILDERSGRMLTFKAPAIMLENVYCRSEMSSGRLYCPRRIMSYWREIWLEPVGENGQSDPYEQNQRVK